MPITHISVRGARQHNLRDINVRIPRNTLTWSRPLRAREESLAFDTIYARAAALVETLSAYPASFWTRSSGPTWIRSRALAAISIEQKTTSRSPRSTWALSRRYTTTCALL